MTRYGECAEHQDGERGTTDPPQFDSVKGRTRRRARPTEGETHKGDHLPPPPTTPEHYQKLVWGRSGDEGGRITR